NCDQIICLGDIIGFSYPHYNFFETRNARECIEIVRSNCKIVLIGNHDLYAIKKLPEHKAYFNYPKNWYDLDFEEREKLADNKLWLYEDSEFSSLINKNDKAYLNSLPEYEIAEFDGIKFLFSHFLYPDLTGCLKWFPDKFINRKEHLKFMQNNECLIGISGHTHIEGFVLGTEDKAVYHPFREYQIEKQLQWISSPYVANGTRENGFMILNTDSLELEVIPL
ncbi:MAG: metallophosphoesterase, partial [Bacteroidales bacterium]|nr:metallophosphoesterase [Bacteroidales bacterium]